MTRKVALSIESIPEGYRYILQAPSVTFFTKFLLGVLTLASLGYVLSILVRSEVSEGAIIGAIVVTLILLFITRLFLWNTFGKEVFEITDYKLRHYNDYRFFQDELLNVEVSSSTIFTYEKFLNSDSKSDVLDDLERNISKEYYLVIRQDDKELTKSHLRLVDDQISKIFTEPKIHDL